MWVYPYAYVVLTVQFKIKEQQTELLSSRAEI